ncbi:MAG TPA: DNA polymerase Y family protein [Bryobacteraceae bacterium]|nr:DNA polymerase Y family protein [Bryobacteraceae bacterium]
MFASLHGSGKLAALAFEFSPVVEQTAADSVIFDVAGLERLFGVVQEVAAAIRRRAEEIGAQANLALAANPDAAFHAARGFAGTSILPQGDEAKFLASLPLALLGPSPELQETLERWGIRRFQDLAALPPLGIAERLGPEGLRLRELARGEADRKLVPIEEPLEFRDELELEYPVELLEALVFVLSRLLNGLATRLATRGLATNEVRLWLKLESGEPHERTLRLPAPSLDTRAFLKLLQLDLATHPPAAPVVHVRMEANPVKPRGAQAGLFLPAAPEPVKLELTLARIQAIVGEGGVGSPELIDTHRPGAFRMAQANRPARAPAADRGVRPTWGVRVGFRVFRPARAARVLLVSGHPGFVAAEGVRGKVFEWAGPWRTSGDWWTVDPWSRDEWDIELSDGALYRIYCEPRGWFVEGSYD